MTGLAMPPKLDPNEVSTADNYPKSNIIDVMELSDNVPIENDNPLSRNKLASKRPLEIDLNGTKGKYDIGSPKSKKINCTPPRYHLRSQGPFEVVVQSRDQKKISPFHVGKLLKTCKGIEHVKRSGKHITITCKDYETANGLVDSKDLENFKVFIPTLRVQSVGVVFIDPEVTENEITTEAISESLVLNAYRLKKKIWIQDKGETKSILVDTHYMKLTFDSDVLPKEIKLNHVLMKVEPYIIPVRQCFRCFSYGHVANSPCNKPRICRNCAEPFHEGECVTTLKCVHCSGEHCSNSKSCPEFIRQKNIKNRMSLFKESYFTASQMYPITYRKVFQSNYVPVLTKQYSEAVKVKTNESGIPLHNKFESLNNHLSNVSCDSESRAINHRLLRNPYRRNQIQTLKSHSDHTYSSSNTQLPIKSKLKTHQRPTTTILSPNDKNLLVRRLRAKIEELKNSIQENITKNEIDEFFDFYLNDSIFTTQDSNSVNDSGQEQIGTVKTA